jgi:hypothetical protein
MIINVEQLVECLARENIVLRKKQPHCHSDHHKSYMTRPRLKSGPPQWEAGD